ncbi:MAG TPA: secondary thiamine-phosphate synthase enzyme YjbQ [Candidatus Saccharimonadales bacterium]|nr:secondary thiamine-phosphate synthase enzyme YjbQ [Candidatus Saccharimonadales bacterium]
MKKLTITTHRSKKVVDITERINSELKDLGVKDGTGTLFVAHTTAALTTADLDPGTDLDILDAFDQLIPKLDYRHPHNPAHAPDHILASLIGPSLSLIIENGQLVLGTWQRIVLVELDGPRQRDIVLSM